MTAQEKNADASVYYHENATADVARMNSSTVYGNLADAMKNTTMPFPPPQITQTVTIISLSGIDESLEDDN